MSSAVLFDGTRCIGCRGCSVACKSWNRKPEDMEEKVSVEGGIEGKATVSAKTYTFMRYREVGEGDDFKWAFAKIQCMHCVEPACAGACIVGALKRSETTGAVVYDRDKCIGCRYCMVACPFGIPTYEWDQVSPWIKKCTFCADRQHGNESELAGSLQPACVTACPTDALEFFEDSDDGDGREKAIAEARARIDAAPGRYYDHIYGEEEVGGTAWMYISSVSPDDLDMPQLNNEPVPRNARKAMGTLPYYALGVVGLMAGIYWITKRREKMAAGAGEKKEG